MGEKRVGEQMRELADLEARAAELDEQQEEIDAERARLTVDQRHLEERLEQSLRNEASLDDHISAIKVKEEILRAQEKYLDEKEQRHLEACREQRAFTERIRIRQSCRGKENINLKRQMDEQYNRMQEIKQKGWRPEPLSDDEPAPSRSETLPM